MFEQILFLIYIKKLVSIYIKTNNNVLTITLDNLNTF